MEKLRKCPACETENIYYQNIDNAGEIVALFYQCTHCGYSEEKYYGDTRTSIVVSEAEEGVWASEKRLYELAKADREGRVVVLPCKVGDIIYRIFDRWTKCSAYGEYPDGYGCAGCEEKCDSEPIKVVLPIMPKTLSELCRDIPDFGKTVFLTREEAEKALKEKEGEKDNG